MATQTAPLGLRLFLEGVEVPVIGSQINIQQGQPAAASIQIVPADSSLLLLPRTLVHLFYLDNEFVEPAQIARNQNDRNRFRVSDKQYKLLFCGEVIGYSYTKTPNSRSMILQCLDLSSYWDTCYQWFADFSVSGDGLTDKRHNFTGAGQYLFNNIASGTSWVIGDLLASKPENPDYAKTEGLLAGYIHLLESIGGLRPRAGTSYKSFRGVNDFFTVAELRYNLSGMIGAVESDKTSANMFNSVAFREWLQNGMTSAGSLVTFRDVMALVGEHIFHDVYPNPAALYVQGGTKITQRVPTVIADTAVGKSAISDIERFKETLDRVIRNVAGTSLSSASTMEARDGPVLLTEGLFFGERAAEDIATSGSSDASRINTLLLLATSTARSVLTDFRTLKRENRTITVPSFFSSYINKKLQAAIDNLDRILKSGSTKKTREQDVAVTTGDHLYNQLLLPETFFVVPPRCNVMFPDMYFSFSYSRQFLREITRLSCQAGLGFIAGDGGANDSILGSYYFAPNVRDVNNEIARKTIFSSGTTIMPHEIHAGIIPRFEWVTEGHRWGTEAAKAVGQNSQGKKINYIQRLANFQFFLRRWEARGMNVQGRFNPHVVCGFPGVIIDRTTPALGALLSSTNRIDSGQAFLPTAYIGKVATIQHTVGQDGGVTSVAYTQARTHRGIDDEFLGVLSTEQAEGAKSDVVATVGKILSTVKARKEDVSTALPNYAQQIFIIQLYAQGRLSLGLDTVYGQIEAITESPSRVELTASDFTLLSLSFDDFLTMQQRQGVASTASKTSMPSEIKVNFNLKISKGKYIRREGGAPFEELVRPDYYAAEVWDNANITNKVYLPLVGSRAITDDNNVGDPAQFAALVKTAIDSAGEIQSVITVVAEGDNLVLKVDGRTAGVVGLNLETGTTTETAIDGLTMLYGVLKQKNLDVQSFIDDYIKRPIASLIDILGDSDLQFDASGNRIARADGSTPVEGFHSRAFGPYNADVKQRVDTGSKSTKPEAGKDAFLGLIPASKVEEFNNASTIIRKNDSRTKKPIPLHLDPRGRAQARVRAYVDELTAARAILAT